MADGARAVLIKSAGVWRFFPLAWVQDATESTSLPSEPRFPDSEQECGGLSKASRVSFVLASAAAYVDIE